MFRLVSIENCNNFNETLDQVRCTFAEVFSEHYSTLIDQAKTAIRANFKENIFDDAKLRADQKTLNGFSDLFSKPKFFPNPDIYQYSKAEITAILKTIYFGVGFDDEVAFLRFGKDLKKSGKPPAECYAENISKYSADDSKEINDYLMCLQQEGRVLKDIDFLVLQNKWGSYGFLIYHIFEHQGETIVHVRQAAMLKQHGGHAAFLGASLADRYPHGYYEANQRRSNKVPMKHILIDQHLLGETVAQLGYNNTVYLGLRSGMPLLKTLLAYSFIDLTDISSKPAQARGKILDRRTRVLGGTPDYTTSLAKANDAESFSSNFFKAANLSRATRNDDTHVSLIKLRV